MKKKRVTNLKTKMLLILLACIGVSFSIILIMFLFTTKSLEDKTMESLANISYKIDANINAVLRETYAASEAMAAEPKLLEYLDKNYGGELTTEKIGDIINIRSNIFQNFNRAQTIDQISAIYSVSTNELFNFSAYKVQGEDTIEKLLQMNITDKKKLSKYYWYPLQDNFLVSSNFEDPRLDRVVMGSRRIYSSRNGKYPYVHIFAIEEQKIYDCYEEIVEENGAQVYVLTPDGELLSSSELAVVESGIVPQEIKDLLEEIPQQNLASKINGEEYFVNVEIVEEGAQRVKDNDWITVVAIPKATVMSDINRLYFAIFLVMLFCILLCFGMILYLYKKFMNPISTLSEAMQRVDQGDLQSYVEYKDDASETSQILVRYNLMLDNINYFLEERVRLETEKRDLDMQVLTSQIDPHFLYNTLETIVWKSNEANRPDIGKIASSLGRLYRISVNGGQMWTTLAKEIEHVKSYVEIQQARYQDEFSIEYDIDEAALEMSLPKLILQPIVENIFLHAMPESEEPIQIRIQVEMVSENVAKVVILDNGPGIEPEKLTELREKIGERAMKNTIASGDSKTSGIGLKNINSRLKLYMNEKGEIKIYSKKGLGTKVVVFLTKPADDKNKP